MADKRVRAATRATITRTTNTAKEILATEASEDSSVQLQGLANLLRSKLNLIDELDRKILAEWDDDNNELLAKEIEDSGNYQQTIYSTLAEIESFLHASTTVKDDDVFSRSSRISSRYDDDPDAESAVRPGGFRAKRHIKRPTINMQTFD